MGRNKKRKRQKHSLALVSSSVGRKSNEAEVVLVSQEGEAPTTLEEILEGDIQTTLQTIKMLAETPLVFQSSKRYKELRKAIQPLVMSQIHSYHHGTDYRVKVSQALQHRKWTDALAALSGCRDYAQFPKQGTIQRWVRDCDDAPATCKMQLLHAILKTNQQDSKELENSASDGPINKHDPSLAIAEHLSTKSGEQAEDLEILEDWTLGRLMPSTPDEVSSSENQTEVQSKVLYREKAEQRTPPNHFDLLLHVTARGCIRWGDASQKLPTKKHPVPFLPNGHAFLLENVLSIHECQQFRDLATALGYRPDHPTSMDEPTGIDSCEWMVDESILEVINERVLPFLPNQIASSTMSSSKSDGVEFHSINPRWRFFRYGQQCVYRPHIDGSWPLCRVNEKNEYECDKSGSVKSYLTFLIYLNDNFEGGQTRFYFNESTNGRSETPGRLVAQGVTPRCGSVLVFLQGNRASLVHEGSAVTKGTKYVVRTDVLYSARRQ